MKRFTSMKTLLTKHVISDWVTYLSKKKIRARRTPENKLKEVVLHKKVLRDWREFYRILFRLRFRPFEFNTVFLKDECIQILLFELGIWKDLESHCGMFPFFYQIHLPNDFTKYTPVGSKTSLENYSTCLSVFDKYNQEKLDLFFKDDLCLALCKYVYENFYDLYFKNIKSTVKPRIRKIIKNLLGVAKLP